ncbi:hypothetical protein HRbin36_02216 [bacterium HR36]|nr:hypothetical protein HRbin36_02216 [bacterium HR36]
MGQQRLFEAALHRGDRRQVKHRITTLHRLGHRTHFGDTAGDHFDLPKHRGQVFPFAGAKIVQDAHPIAPRQQRFYQMRTEESSTTRDQTSSHSVSIARNGVA